MKLEKDHFSLKEALQIIAKHMQDLAKNEESSPGAQYAESMRDKEIGKTKSGKAIMGNPHHTTESGLYHADTYSSDDHEDAHAKHKELASATTDTYVKKYHNNAANVHSAQIKPKINTKAPKGVN